MNDELINVLQLEPEQFLSLIFYAVYKEKLYEYFTDDKYDCRYVDSKDIDRYANILGKNFLKYENKTIGIMKPDSVVYCNYGEFDNLFEYFPLPNNRGYGYQIKKGYNDEESYFISLKLEELISFLIIDYGDVIRSSNIEFLNRYSLKNSFRDKKAHKKLGKIKLPFHS